MTLNSIILINVRMSVLGGWVKRKQVFMPNSIYLRVSNRLTSLPKN